MIFESFPPALILLTAALLAVIARPTARTIILLLAPLLTLWAIWSLPDGVLLTTRFLGYAIEPLEVSPVRRMFATVFTIMVFVGVLFSFKTAKTAELGAATAYASGAVGVSFAGDLITLFIWWEMMAIFSTIVIWCGGTEAARRAGIRYAMMHILSGVMLKIGIEGVYVHTGSLDIVALQAVNLNIFALQPLDIDIWLVLAGILINAAAPPFSAWLPDAYPETSPDGGGVPVGVHHQDRGAGADPAVPRRRGADLGRPVHGVLRHHHTRCWKTTCGASWPIRSSTRWASWSAASASAPRWR
jgi:multicomponent Na+:H+ antiporter subunit D